jgi:hypothetical protein
MPRDGHCAHGMNDVERHPNANGVA